MKVVTALLAACAFLAGPVLAGEPVSDGKVKIGVLNDRTGPYSDYQGEGSAAAARLALEDFGPTVLGKPIEIITGDHQNKADIGSVIARRWIDTEDVDMLVDFGNSAVSLAVQEVTRDRRVTIHVSSAADTLFGEKCSRTGFVWNYDSGAIARAIGISSQQTGADSWFFLVADYGFGHVMEKALKEIVTAAGGRVVGAVRHPVGASDFSSYLLQAQGSGAKTIALLNAGDDTTNAIKQAAEFAITQGGQKLAATAFYVTNVHTLTLPVAHGLRVATPFYWDQNDASRQFTARWRAAMNTDRAPTHLHAGVYSAVLAYLRAIEAAGTDDALAVSAKMKELPVDDLFAEGARIREDGRLMRDMYLAEVKTPEESNGPWDYYKLLVRMPAEDIIRPLADGGCPFITAGK